MRRRVSPPGFRPDQLLETAILADFALAGLKKIPGNTSNSIANKLHWYIQRKLASEGAYQAEGAEVVVASYVVAQPAFEKTTGKRILNYPIAHHRYIQKFIAEEAELEPTFASTLPDWSSVPNWVQPRLDLECELADHILVGSSFARDSFIEEGVPSNKLVIIPYGANVSQFVPTSTTLSEHGTANTPASFNVLFVGQIGQRKGVSYLLRGYQKFSGPGTQLTLVGNYAGDAGSLTPYRDYFRHISHAPQTMLADLYRQADVFVFPTLIEGLPLVVLEAMASGLPVIVTPNGPGDVVRDGIDGFVIPIRDSNAIAEKLEFLRAHPERRAEMGRNARERALMFTWKEYRRKVLQFLLETPPQNNTR